MISKLVSRKAALAGAALTLAGFCVAALPSTSAEAGWRGRGYGGYGYGGYGNYYRGGYGYGGYGGYGYRGGYGYGGYRGYNTGAAVAAGVVGLAAGAIIGSAVSQPRYYAPPPTVYYAPSPNVVYAPPPTDPSLPAPSGTYYRSAGYAPAPGSADWNAYCASKYRSFDPRSGTYLGYDGQRHYCR